MLQNNDRTNISLILKAYKTDITLSEIESNNRINN